MPESRSIPRPTPIDELPAPDIPPEMQPPEPGPLRVVQIVPTGKPELAAIFKRSYEIRANGTCVPTEEQIPLDDSGSLHDPLSSDQAPACKSLPEIVGYKSGTDLVIQATARPRHPATEMMVSARVGAHRHTVMVTGARFCEYVRGRLHFTPPRPFEEMPLRYENAYGGRDPRFEAALLAEVEKRTPPASLRRVRPPAAVMLAGGTALAYPRNRFGKGYVLEERREFIEGRALPEIERPDDRLTPERLVVDNLPNWTKQPIPAGFDYLDPLAFPRTAMLGFAPALRHPPETLPEIQKGLVPADICRGHILTARPEAYDRLVHPDAGRCASLGMWLPALRGDEEIVLAGMNTDSAECRIPLPGDVPEFTIKGVGANALKTRGVPLLVFIDLHERILNVIWSGRIPLEHPLPKGRDRQIQDTTTVELKQVSP